MKNLLKTMLIALAAHGTSLCLDYRPSVGLPISISQKDTPRGKWSSLWATEHKIFDDQLSSQHPAPGHSPLASLRHLVHIPNQKTRATFLHLASKGDNSAPLEVGVIAFGRICIFRDECRAR